MFTGNMSADARNDILGGRRAEAFKLELSGVRVGSTVGLLRRWVGLIVIVSGHMREKAAYEYSRMSHRSVESSERLTGKSC